MKNKLLEIMKRDQARVVQLDKAYEDGGLESFNKLKKSFESQINDDELYIRKYLSNFKDYPLDNKPEVVAVFLVAQHSDNEDLKKELIEFTKHYSDLGIIGRSYYALAIDRYNTEVLKMPQIYGTQIYYDLKLKENILIETDGGIDETINRRKKDKIEEELRLEDYLAGFNITIDDARTKIKKVI